MYKRQGQPVAEPPGQRAAPVDQVGDPVPTELAQRRPGRESPGPPGRLGGEVVNDVVLNQVLVGFGADDRTDPIVDAVQRDGTCWLGATTWRGRRLMRVSVSNHSTREDDVDRSVAAILRLAASV